MGIVMAHAAQVPDGVSSSAFLEETWVGVTHKALSFPSLFGQFLEIVCGYLTAIDF